MQPETYSSLVMVAPWVGRLEYIKERLSSKSVHASSVFTMIMFVPRALIRTTSEPANKLEREQRRRQLVLTILLAPLAIDLVSRFVRDFQVPNDRPAARPWRVGWPLLFGDVSIEGVCGC